MLDIDRPWVSIEEQEEDLIFLDLLEEIDHSIECTLVDGDLVDDDNSIVDCFD